MFLLRQESFLKIVLSVLQTLVRSVKSFYQVILDQFPEYSNSSGKLASSEGESHFFKNFFHCAAFYRGIVKRK
jgi:hypothetical protein